MPYRVPDDHTAFARRLRQDMTRAETLLWRALRGSAVDGAKFRRQAPIGRYVADFLCVEHRLIVELDGPPHDDVERRQHDAVRDRWLREHRYRVLRFPDDIVIGGGNIVIDLIREAIRHDHAERGEPSSGSC